MFPCCAFAASPCWCSNHWCLFIVTKAAVIIKLYYYTEQILNPLRRFKLFFLGHGELMKKLIQETVRFLIWAFLSLLVKILAQIAVIKLIMISKACFIPSPSPPSILAGIILFPFPPFYVEVLWKGKSFVLGVTQTSFASMCRLWRGNCLGGYVRERAGLCLVREQIQLCCFASYVMFVFVSESCLIISMGNVAATDTATSKAVFLSSHLFLDLKV